jgi:hypothetical protein
VRLIDGSGGWVVKYRKWDMGMGVGVYGGEGSRVGCAWEPWTGKRGRRAAAAVLVVAVRACRWGPG